GSIGGAIAGAIMGPIGGIFFGRRHTYVFPTWLTLLATLPGVFLIFLMTLKLICGKASARLFLVAASGISLSLLAATICVYVIASLGYTKYFFFLFLGSNDSRHALGGLIVGILFGLTYGIGLGSSSFLWRFHGNMANLAKRSPR